MVNARNGVSNGITQLTGLLTASLKKKLLPR